MARKVTASVDEEGYQELQAYKASRGLGSVDDAATLALRTGINRLTALDKYSKSKAKEAKAAGKAKAAPKPKAAAKPKSAAAKPKPAAAKAKAKPAAKGAKAAAAPKSAVAAKPAKKEAASADKPKRSSLLSAAKKGNGASRLAPAKPSPVGAVNGTPAITSQEVAEA